MRNVARPVIAIVGRTNVGKSTLFNKLVGRRAAIVQNQHGVTRDRHVAQCSYRLRHFTLIDTAGLVTASETASSPESGAQRQAEIAIRDADLLLFMVDGREGVTPLDESLHALLRKSGKPIHCVINKTEAIPAAQWGEFYRLGTSSLHPISSEHNQGISDLLDALYPCMTEACEAPAETIPHVVVLGRPNAGKSTLINTLLREERLVTSDVPGTTRDAIDSRVTHHDQAYLFIDTAGIRRRGKIAGVEQFGVVRAKEALARADVALLLIDGVEGITEQDTKIAGLILEATKGILILVNKSDRLDPAGRARIQTEIGIRFSFLRDPKTAFISAQNGTGLSALFENTDAVYRAMRIRVSTGDLNRFFAKVIQNHPPPLHRGREVRVYYITQAAVCPPTFVLFVNTAEGFPGPYLRYVENQLRTTFGFGGAPIRIRLRGRAN